MITEYGRIYGSLVLVGKRALSDNNNPNFLPVVPEKYQQEAADYLDYIAEHGKENDNKTLTDRVNELEEQNAELQEQLEVLASDNAMFNDMFLLLMESSEDIDFDEE